MKSLMAILLLPSLATPVAQLRKKGTEKRFGSWSAVTALGHLIRFEKVSDYKMGLE